jgi:electron transport complex protein RnfG
MVLVLTAVALFSSLALSLTYTLTKEAIQAARIKKILDGIEATVPQFDNNPFQEKYSQEGYEGLEFYPARRDGELVGTAVKTFSENGFEAEKIWLMVGFDRDLKIRRISVISHKETPGLGSRMGEPEFLRQFDGKDAAVFKLAVKKDNGDVDAISAATISSRAFCEAVGKAHRGLTEGRKE